MHPDVLKRPTNIALMSEALDRAEELIRVVETALHTQQVGRCVRAARLAESAGWPRLAAYLWERAADGTRSTRLRDEYGRAAESALRAARGR